MKEKLSQFIKTRPTFFQIAKDNKWEEAWIIDLSKPLPPESKISQYLHETPYSYLAVEYQWDQPEGAYVLHIGHNRNMKINKPKDFLVLALSIAIKYQDFSTFIRYIDDKIIGQRYLFSKPLDLIRVSIFNHWFSSSPVDIWTKEDPKSMTIKQLKSKFKGHENLLKTNLNFQAMALAYDYDFEGGQFGVRHVLKVPSAKKEAKTWFIDFELMSKYLQELEGFVIL